jgi:hypothetical protein
MESVNVGDSLTYAAGQFPTSREDWAHNFQFLPAPVHHLQTNAPGNMYFAEGYQITGISVNSLGYATIYCPNDCSFFEGDVIYVSGNSSNALNGIWQENCSSTMTCTSYQLQFTAPAGMVPCSPCGTAGIVWAPDYWPITMPLAIQHGATSIEVWECSLDYAFYPVETTNWVSPGGSAGCANWGWAPALGDLSYVNTLGNALIGQPSSTSFRTGVSTLTNGKQF